MEIINYVLVLLVSFLGLFVGNLIAFFTKEELKSGEKWFKTLEKIIFVLILVVFTLYFFYVQEFITLVVVLVLSIYFRLTKLKFKESLIYFMLGVIFYLSSESNIFMIEAALVFLYGIPIGSLITKELKKEFLIIKNILIRYVVFLVVGMFLIFLLP